MKRKLLYLFLILLLFIIGGFYYVNAFFLPVQLKQILTTKAKEILGRNLTIKEISYNPLQGIVIKDAVLYRLDDPQLPLASIEEASGNIVWPAIFTSRKIIVPVITIQKPYVHLVRDQYGSWNFTDLLNKRLPPSQNKKGALSFILGGINVNQGKIQLTYPFQDRIVTDVFDDIRLKIGLSLPKGFTYELSILPPEAQSALKVNGDYNLLTHDVAAQVSIQKINAAKYLNLFYSTDRFTLQEGYLDNASGQIKITKRAPSFEGALQGKLDLIFSQKAVSEIKTSFAAANAKINILEDSIQVSGDVKARQTTIALANQNTIAGDFATKGFTATFRTQPFELKGDFAVENADILFPDREIKGNYRLDTVQLRFWDPQLSVFGNLQAENPQVTMNQNVLVTGKELSVGSFRLTRDDKDVSLTTGKTQFKDAQVNTEKISLAGQFSSNGIFFTSKDGKTEVKGGGKLLRGGLVLAENQRVSGSFSSENIQFTNFNRHTSLAASLWTDQALLVFDDKKLTPGVQVRLDLQFFPGKDGQQDFKVSVATDEAVLTGVPRVGEIKNLSGQISVSPNQAETNLLKMNVLGNNIELSGKVTNFQHPFLTLKASSSSLNLKTLSELLADELAPYAVKAEGQTAIKFSYTGALDSPQQAEITTFAILKNASLFTEKLPAPVTGISGSITYAKNKMTWQNLKANYQNKTYRLDGNLTNMASPLIVLQLSTDNLNLSSTVEFSKNLLTVKAFNGRFYDSAFDVTGNIRFPEKPAPGTTPRADLRSHVELNLHDLAALSPPFAEKLKNLNPIGVLSTDLTYKGEIAGWRSAQMLVLAQSDQIFLSYYKFTAISLKFEQKGQTPAKMDFKSSFYDGPLKITALADLKDENISYQLQGSIENLNVGKLRKDTPLKERNITGLLTAAVDLGGFVLKSDQLQGKGNINITAGYLWEFDLVKGAWSTLSKFLIPELQQIAFTDATANFTIADTRMTTNNLWLKSQPVDVLVKGWVGFDQKVNLDAQPKFKEIEILKSGSPLKTPSAILAGATDVFSIKIGGTLSKPSIGVDTLPGKVLEKATGALIDNVKSILEEIMPSQ